MNERIRAREVRLVDENGGQMGVVPTREALDLSRQRGYDLIEIAPTAKPPVCKLMDYGKFKYEQGRRDRESHKKQKSTEVKGIRLRPGTGDHDIETKLKRMLQFLREGNKVKTTVIFRSREMSHPEFARRSLEKMIEAAAEIAVVEKPPSFEGRTMTMVLAPRVLTEKDKTEKKTDTAGDKAQKAEAAPAAEEEEGGKAEAGEAKEKPKPDKPAKSRPALDPSLI